MQDALSSLHRYPDASCYELVRTISRVWKMDPVQIAIGNGSNELIDLLVRIYCEPGDSILTTQTAFVAYSVCAHAARVRPVAIPMAPGFKTDLKAMGDWLEKNLEKEKTRIVFLPNPNNPTGTYITAAEVEAFLKKFGSRDDILIVFDEAYNEFVRAADYKSGMQFMSQYSNVAVLRTLSKAYGLAGLRVGVLLAPPGVIDLVNRVRNPFNVNGLAQVAAVAALEDYDFIQKSVEITWQGLDYFYEELAKMKLPYVASQANFVMFDTLRDVKQVDESLLRRGVILRPILNYGFTTHLRMSVGLAKENQIAIKTLQDVLKTIPLKT